MFRKCFKKENKPVENKVDKQPLTTNNDVGNDTSQEYSALYWQLLREEQEREREYQRCSSSCNCNFQAKIDINTPFIV